MLGVPYSVISRLAEIKECLRSYAAKSVNINSSNCQLLPYD